ncbi:BKACE family enzyme [Ruegeria aquimaris]|uniref:3-keto-5-aminohexanoate cleavage protein n=1 Tax=Ruegeria aquimaris TaxID=2984333 RepID=A0ABT3ALI8_9RHOB|nr:3-keto-5-aminohexanoate cleavage protein [Ruegeria sp. XHP0148]MCV2889526.1 3-keto-5-aminohexanoate cleavage protein [Ruegeria sp. XHP0148]
MTQPLIMVAPNGARRGKEDHVRLPLDLVEIVAEARLCHAAGADALHLHIRDTSGMHSLDAGLYREALTELARSVPGIAVQITTEAAGIYSPTEQYACLDALRPAWASVSLREIARDPDLAPRLYALAADQGIRLQHIAYDRGDLDLLAQSRATGIIRAEQDEVICVLGAYAPPRAGRPEELAALAPALDGLRLGLCAFGPQEQACLLAGARAGAEVLRVGFENNLLSPDGTPWPDNSAAVASLRHHLERKAA